MRKEWSGKERRWGLGEVRVWGLLGLGVLLLCLAHMRWGVGLFAWFVPVPFLVMLRRTGSWRARLLFLVVFCLGWSLVVLKITTAPIPRVMAFAFGIPIGLCLGVGYVVWDVLRERLSRGWGVLLFAALLVLAEWVQHALTPFASWGSAAYTQMDNVVLLQSVSLFGMAGLSFLVYWVGAWLESAWVAGREALGHGLVLLGVLGGLYAFGSLRLAVGDGPGQETVLVAAVGTDATFGGLPLPSRERIERVNDGLFRRTRRAARAGARLVVWNEGATLLFGKEEEKAWGRRLSVLAKTSRVHLVAAYIVLLDKKPLRYANKYRWFGPDGRLLQTYHKHKPVPGEPAIAGRKPLRAMDVGFARVSGAICYDYDFPRLGLQHASLGIGLAVLPSSDWLGIDPIHTQMASLRAVEGGYSLLRSTRLGLSAGFDAYGRVRGWMSAFDRGGRVLLVALPVRSVTTLYSLIGDLFVALCALWVLVVGVVSRFFSPRVPEPVAPSESVANYDDTGRLDEAASYVTIEGSKSREGEQRLGSL